MCGIAGFYGFKNDDLIKKISKELAHRGPDGEGFFIEDEVTLLSRRLAIIDRKGGVMPIYNETKSIVVVYNGEIYNYKELREALEKAGHTFKTNSDTEVIVHGYEEWGEAAFDEYNGMFGVALYDKKKKKLILARDHFGIKPLYYSITKDKSVIFSSELKPIINSGLIEKVPNDKIIYRYLNFRIHDDNEETFFKGINRLMPGEMMIVDSKGVRKQYFSQLKKELLETKPGPLTADGQQSFREKLIESIRMRLVSEVPVGSALSGGLDSSTVVAVINKLLLEKAKDSESVGKNQNTFSAVFPNSTNDEEKYIDELLKQMKNVKSHKILPKPEEFFEDLEDFVRTQEEPTISTGPYAQYKVMQEAHKHVTVLLDGQGSDEMMAGYLPYYFVYLNQLKSEGKYFRLLGEIFSSLDVLTKYFIQKVKLQVGTNNKVATKKLLKREFIDEHSQERFVVNNSNLRERLVEDIFHNSLPSLLRYEDKNAMRFSIEGRVPFLDFNLLRFLFSLDEQAIIKNGWNKNILRNAVKDLLPDLITWRRNKIGFTTPENEWFMRMKNRIYSYFLSESFANRKYFNQTEVLKSFEDFIKGKNDDTMVYWRMLNVEMWLREFFDEKKEEKKKKEKGTFDPNEGKELEIIAGVKPFVRFPVKTDLFGKGDDIAKKIAKHVKEFLSEFEETKKFSHLHDQKWFVVLSEKIVAISQGRSYFIWDIHTGFWAKTLSKFVLKTPYGIGLGSPWTMQLAINEVGLPRMILAAAFAAIGKVVGIKGLFYRIAGSGINAIDGPTEYSLYPSNVSAKLPPKDPEKVAKEVNEKLLELLPKSKMENFEGVVIIDANDLGRNVLGNATKYDSRLVEEIFKDNPMGQGSEQTPLVLVYNTK